MKEWKKFNNQNGLSLVEMLMAGLLVGGLSLVALKSNLNQQNTVNKNRENLEVQESLKTAKSILSNKKVCEEFLANIDVSDLKSSDGVEIDLSNVEEDRASVIFKRMSEMKFAGNTKVESIVFKLEPLSGEQHNLKMEMTLNKKGSTSTKSINKIVSVFADEISCSSYITNQVDYTPFHQICAQMGGVGDEDNCDFSAGLNPILSEQITRSLCLSLNNSASSITLLSGLCPSIELSGVINFQNIKENGLVINGQERTVFDYSECTSYSKGYEVGGNKNCADLSKTFSPKVATVVIPGDTTCPASWTPARSSVCNGEAFVQNDGCGASRNTTGTKTDGECAVNLAECGTGTNEVSTARNFDTEPTTNACASGVRQNLAFSGWTNKRSSWSWNCFDGESGSTVSCSRSVFIDTRPGYSTCIMPITSLSSIYDGYYNQKGVCDRTNCDYDPGNPYMCR